MKKLRFSKVKKVAQGQPGNNAGRIPHHARFNHSQYTYPSSVHHGGKPGVNDEEAAAVLGLES